GGGAGHHERVAQVQVEVLLEDREVVLEPERPLEQVGAVERPVALLQAGHDQPEEREQAPQQDDPEQSGLAPELGGVPAPRRPPTLQVERPRRLRPDRIGGGASHRRLPSVPMTRSRPSSRTKMRPMPRMSTNVRVDKAAPNPGSGVRTTYCWTNMDSDSVSNAPRVMTCGRSYTRSASTVRNSSATRIAGRSNGRVMCQNRANGPAPSTRALS